VVFAKAWVAIADAASGGDDRSTAKNFVDGDAEVSVAGS
jgi:hypothetical protein